jgi:hypothetical protein
LPLADLAVFIKVPPPEFRQGMSKLGHFTSLMSGFGYDSILDKKAQRSLRLQWIFSVDVRMNRAGGLTAARRAG